MTPAEQLVAACAGFRHDPLGFVRFAFDWGVGELKNFSGPELWQAKVLGHIGERLREHESIASGHRPVIRVAVASGNGIGKSATISMILNWGLSTNPDTRVNITAGTGAQLKTKTWPEVATWFRRSITNQWFSLQATSITSRQPAHEHTWRADCVSWSKENPEAFSGLHNQRKMVVLIMDEASGIADNIFEYAEGACTDADTDVIFIAFGNPTRREGYFYSIFHERKKDWFTLQIDSRTVGLTNKEELQKFLEFYGEDSDWFRVHVRGEFPLSSVFSFIHADLVEAARRVCLREAQFEFAPVVIGVDGSYRLDEAVITMRQGLYSHMLWAGNNVEDDVWLANLIAQYEDALSADAVYVDMGNGTGIVSAGKALGRKWQLVSFAEKASKPGILNKRAEMYYDCKQALKDGMEIDDDPRLQEQLICAETKARLDGKLQLEGKEEIIKRLGESPGRADALVLTFAYPVRAKTDHTQAHRREKKEKRYDPLSCAA